MKQKWINKVNLKGYLYDVPDRRNGTPGLQMAPDKYNINRIKGEIQIATDEYAMNIVTVKVNAPETYRNSGKSNTSFPLIKAMMEGNVRTYRNDATNAEFISVDGELDVRTYTDRNGQVRNTKDVRGSFINKDNTRRFLADFQFEGVFNSAVAREYDDGTSLALSGYVFNYMGNVMPVSLAVRDSAIMSFIQDQDVSNSNPLVTSVWGSIVTNTVTVNRTAEDVIGQPTVSSTSKSFQSWDVTGTKGTPMEYGEGGAISPEEMRALLQKREEKLAADAAWRAAHARSNAASTPAAAFSAPAQTAASTYDVYGDIPF